MNQSPRSASGFTLVELIVVILVLAVMVAWVVPSFLQYREKADDSAAKQKLTLVYKTLKSETVDKGGQFPTSEDIINAVSEQEPEISIALTGDPEPGQVGVKSSSATRVEMFTRGGGGKCLTLTATINGMTISDPEDCAAGAGTTVDPSLLSGVVQIDAGYHSTCALLDDGTVACWGDLGGGSYVPQIVSGLADVTQIAVGYDFGGSEHLCAVVSGGTVECLGGNYDGELGDGTTTDSDTPVTVSGITNAVQVAASSNSTCALLAGGAVKCWGNNEDGQLGDGDTTSSTTPVVVTGITNATQISAGGTSSVSACALLSGGTVKCWGSNWFGQQGDGGGMTADNLVPGAVTGITNAVSVSAGHTSNCAVISDGTVSCWGSNNSSQLGYDHSIPKQDCEGCSVYYTPVLPGMIYPSSTTPVTVPGPSSATAALSVGGLLEYTRPSPQAGFACVVLADSRAQCWGENSEDQLGAGVGAGLHASEYWNDWDGGRYSFEPLNVIDGDTMSDLTGVTSVAAGAQHACALMADTTVKCWGAGHDGQVGDGAGDWYYSSATDVAAVGGGDTGDDDDGDDGGSGDTGTDIMTLTGLAQVGVGDDHSCAVSDAGGVMCWGDNSYGQLGDGTSDDSIGAVDVSGISGASRVDGAYSYTCALLSSGGIKCWGDGPLGDGSGDSSSTPVDVSGVSSATAVNVGYDHACALLSDGSVQCWGDNSYGQLGDGTNTGSDTPVAVSGITNAIAVTSGDSHSCALLSGGAVKCWGDNEDGQLGDGSFSSSNVPVSVSGVTNAVSIAGGGLHSCAVLSSGAVKCWGGNGRGQLGDGSLDPSNTPVSVSGISTATEVSAGYTNTCARLLSGTVKCWGWNQDGSPGSKSTSPVSVSGLSDATAVAVGYEHSCALVDDDSVFCWGDGSGAGTDGDDGGGE